MTGRMLPLSAIAIKSTSVPPRLCFFFLAIPLQMLAESLYLVFGRNGNLFIVCLCLSLWLVWFGCLFLMAFPVVDHLLRSRRRILHLVTVVVVVLLALLGVAEIVGLHLLESGSVGSPKIASEVTNAMSYNDGTALTHQASEMLLQGENPYTKSSIVTALEDLELPLTVTPLKQGEFAEVFPYPTEDQVAEVFNDAKSSGNPQPLEFESKVSYPAGSFLFHTPFVALGFDDLRIFYLLCALAAAAVIFWKAPPRFRPLVVFAFLVNLILWNLITSGATDTLYVLFVLLGWILRRRLWLSALFMGLAASTKQLAWLYILFYLILIIRETGWKPMLKSMGAMVLVFSAINLPFIFSAPHQWLDGVLAPVLDPMFPRGVGIVGFSIAGILPPNALVFTIVELAVLMAAAAWYYCSGYRYPQVGLLLAALPLFFAWRSYSCYFYFASLLIFGAVIVLEYAKPLGRSDPVRNDRVAFSSHA